MTKNSIVSGLVWSFAERFGEQFISFTVSLILARLLLPKDYGLIAMVTIFINIANCFVTGGFGNALIQKKNADNIDFSTVFYFNLIFSSFVYTIIFFVAPCISDFFGNIDLTLVIRVLGVRIIISGINSVQRAYVSRKMIFKRFFYSTIFGTILSAVVGILLAYLGYGVWALVFQYLTNAFTDTVILWYTVRWRPDKCFNFSRLIELLSYGWKLLASTLLTTVYSELNEIAVGKFYTASDLAFYNKGKKLPSLFVNNVNSAIESVLFPSMSRHQLDISLLKNDVNKAIRISTFLLFPLIFGIASTSNNIILLLLSEKWLPSAKFVAIACLSYAFVPIGMTNLQAIKALGRSDIYLKLDIIKKFIGILLLVFFIKEGVIAIALAESFSNAVGFMINIIPNKRLLCYDITEQILSFLPVLVISLFSSVIVFLENFIHINIFLKFLLQITTGLTLYLLLSKLFRIKALEETVDFIRSTLKK